jgi:RNA polymerase sigma-70 factor (ECF subfamily)
MRQGLTAMLPRLMRFAEMLAGDKDEGRALLRRALIRMLAERHRYANDVRLDCWAFAEIYRRWRNEHRDHGAVLTRVQPTYASFASLFGQQGTVEADAPTVSFLWQLPPQARSTLLLVYGERLDRTTAAAILDTTEEAIAARLARGTVGLADQFPISARPESGVARRSYDARDANYD